VNDIPRSARSGASLPCVPYADGELLYLCEIRMRAWVCVWEL